MQFSTRYRQGAAAEVNVLLSLRDRSSSTVMRAVTVAVSSFLAEKFDLSIISDIRDCNRRCGNTITLGIVVLVLLFFVAWSLISNIYPPVIV